MKPVCPFMKAARPDDISTKRSGDNVNKHGGENEGKMKKDADESTSISPKCPFGYDSQKIKKDADESATVSPKCPFGYDTQNFKLGPLSCMICQALLFQCGKCVPCSHVFCKACISRFKDCPLCGADIEKIEDDPNLQSVVDRFIEGHARIKRSHANTNEEGNDNKKVIYEDVSLERGAFLVQQAMRALRAQNLESAKSRLKLCVEDIHDQVETSGHTPELCSQLGAVLGMLGDCCRAIGDSASAVNYFEESVEFLSKLPADDLEIIHTHSVSLNKIGDLKYYDGDLEAAKSYYIRALNVRYDAIKSRSLPSLTLDVAVSLAKVADIDRNIGNENAALERFREGVTLLESMVLKPEDANLQQRRQSVLEFLQSQLAEKQPAA